MKSGEWRDGECGSCGYEGRVKDYWQFSTKVIPDETLCALCGVCQTTLAGNSAVHPGTYANADVLKMLAQCTNLILAEIRETR